MSKSLYHYYERELTFIRQLSREFADQYPAAAARLRLESNRSTDPHVERLIEAFALLTGRVQAKIDDEFPELTAAMLGVLYPHYLAPLPSMAIAQFVLDPARAQIPDGFLIDRLSRLRTMRINDQPCRFRTGYPTTLWPVQVSAARFARPPYPAGLRPPRGTVAALRIQLDAIGGLSFAELSLRSLRFFLHGEAETTALLYELIFNHALQVVLLPADRAADGDPEPILLTPRDVLRPVGFDLADGLLPYPAPSFPGYRLLSEFFAFPAKFLFVDVHGLEAACRAGFRKRLEVVVFLNRGSEKLEQDVTATTFQLGCTPIVNLFEKTAEPIILDQSRSEYRIVPDVASPLGLEIYSVDEVTGVDPISGRTTGYQPFYSYRHGVGSEAQRTFWYATRRPSMRADDRGTEVELSLVDLGYDPSMPAESTLVVRTTCTNRDLPLTLQAAGERLTLELEAAAPLAAVRCVRSPSAPQRPPLRRGLYWRLLSHLSLNHLSISHGTEGRETLREILRLYDFSDAAVDRQAAEVIQHLIEGIASVTSRRIIARPPSNDGAFCRGTEVTVEFEEEKYVGTGAYLFACVLERFLALYSTINSFTQLVGRTTGGGPPFRVWPPRAGERPLV
ncbi:type VI secretion system baseplate subunit TssF [Aquisphaera insulae]|uniref:type VI secretion system baseplate subunit TssF n=1 Tax=Aquisphaera insulae TaxID=2712864 RepID=UPI0013EBBDB3|nr:type VI secretion system baseplate subunit TssF [Aquisphaera insulae]